MSNYTTYDKINGKLYCRSIALSGFDEFIRGLDGNPVALYLKAGINPLKVKRNDRLIDWNKLCLLFEIAAEELKLPHLGIQFALTLPYDFRNNGPVLFMLHLAKDIREFLDTSFTYNKLHTNGVVFSYRDEIEEKLAVIDIEINPNSVYCRQYIEHLMACITRMVQQGQHSFTFQEISFQHEPTVDIASYEKAFECPVTFCKSKTRMKIDRKFLDLETQVVLRDIQPAITNYLSKLIRKEGGRELSTKAMTSRVIALILGIQSTGIESVANVMALSVKKLQRLLKDEGTSYSKILDETRQKISQDLLFESDVSIQRLSEFLDYKSPEAFNAACKRWFGLSPRECRNQLRQQDEHH